MANVVLKTPQEHKRRHKQQNSPARSQHAIHLTQPREVVVHMFDHVESSYEIKRSVFVRQRFAGSESYLVESTLSTKRERIFRDVDAFRVPIF